MSGNGMISSRENSLTKAKEVQNNLLGSSLTNFHYYKSFYRHQSNKEAINDNLQLDLAKNYLHKH